MKIRDSRRAYLAALIACWILSRCLYLFVLGVRFDSSPLGTYQQYIDPVLLKTALWQSIFYLNQQPPLFNLFLGAMLQLFGSNVNWAFQAVYYGFGLGLAIVLFRLLLRLGVFPALAFLATLLFCASPITLLYENWLFYTYPLTFLLVLSALLLHRYLISRRMVDAAVLFSTMAVIVLTRAVFHWAWVALVFFALWLLYPQTRRQLVLAAALPCLVVSGLYVKNYLVFGTMSPGEFYQKTNFGMMVFFNLPDSAKQELIAAGKITELANSNPYLWLDVSQYRALLPPIKKWGIPFLDQELKSTGFLNLQSQAMTELAQVYYRDAKVAAGQYPGAYPRAVLDNLKHYWLPADQTWPFYGGERPYELPPSRTLGESRAVPSLEANAVRLRKLLHAWDFLFAGQLPLGGFVGKVPWLNLVIFPLCFLFGCRFVTSWWYGRKTISDRAENANAGVLLFMLYNIAYLAAVTILFAQMDHPRYRFKISPFYATLFTLILASKARWAVNWLASLKAWQLTERLKAGVTSRDR